MRSLLASSRFIVPVVLVGCVAGCATCRLPSPPESGEARINTSLSDDQWQPAAAQSARASLVVWADGVTVGAHRGVFGQRFDASGRPDGGEFRVDAAPDAPGIVAQVPDVAMNAAGASVVVWEVHAAISGTPAVRVFARRYGADGRALGASIEVSTTPTSPTAEPAVSIGASGAFAVVWQSKDPETATEDVFVRRYSATGVPLGGPTRVNLPTIRAQNQLTADIAMAPGGAFVVTWFDYGATGEADVLARRYGADGTAAAEAFRVHARSPLLNEQAPAIAMNASGAFVVVWLTAARTLPEHSLGITAQRFNRFGAPVGGPVAVSPAADVSQSLPAVAIDPGGRVVVVWQRARPQRSTDPVQLNDVFARTLGPDGPVGLPVLVNEGSVGYQRVSSVAMDLAGNALVAWDATGPNGDHLDVYVRRYQIR